MKIFLHQLDSIAVSGLALSLNCNRVLVDVCCCLVCENEEGDSNDRARLPYIPVLLLREDGLAVCASNTDTLAIDVTDALLLNAEASDSIATRRNKVFDVIFLVVVDVVMVNSFC